MLVRNSITNVRGSERSAGDELMLLVLTGAQSPGPANTARPGAILIGANGEGEGFSAADLYRISGHPLVAGSSKVYAPSGVKLARNPESVR
jgi:hypothetical protein